MAATAIRPDGWVITESGIIDGMPADEYHADPVAFGSLSSSGARKLVRKCPARFRYDDDKPTKAMQLGTAAHTQVLGAGAEIVEVPGAESNGAWSTTEAKAAVAAARAAGQVPVKPAEYATITAMAAALRAHPKAAELLAPGAGKAEQSAFWFNEEFGIWRRCRFDWLPDDDGSGELIIPDYKKCESADKEAMRKAMANYGYHCQADWYRSAAAHFRPGDRVRFVLVCQEMQPPYLVECYEPDADSLAEGRYWNRAAMEVFRDCMQSGQWPGYNPGDGITSLSLPRWGFRDDEW